MPIGRKIITAINSRMVLAITAFCLGLVIPLTIFGNPPLLNHPEASNWFSGLMSLVAAIVALGLGVHATLESRHEQEERRKSAAAAFLPSVSDTLGIAQSIIERAEEINKSIDAAEFFRQKLSKLPVITPPEALPFLPLLASNLASSAVIVGHRNEIVRNKMSNLRGHPSLATEVINEANNVALACLPFGNHLYEVIFPGNPPPWHLTLNQ